MFDPESEIEIVNKEIYIIITGWSSSINTSVWAESHGQILQGIQKPSAIQMTLLSPEKMVITDSTAETCGQ